MFYQKWTEMLVIFGMDSLPVQSITTLSLGINQGIKLHLRGACLLEKLCVLAHDVLFVKRMVSCIIRMRG